MVRGAANCSNSWQHPSKSDPISEPFIFKPRQARFRYYSSRDTLMHSCFYVGTTLDITAHFTAHFTTLQGASLAYIRSLLHVHTIHQCNACRYSPRRGGVEAKPLSHTHTRPSLARSLARLAWRRSPTQPITPQHPLCCHTPIQSHCININV
jgi:hypothetical protein